MPIIAGLVLVTSLALSSEDDLIGNSQYAIVKDSGSGKAGTRAVVTPGPQGSTKPSREMRLGSAGPGVVEMLPGLGVFAPAQSPFATIATSKLAVLQKKVSVSFHDASATDVFKWLGKQGVNFVGSLDSMPKDRLSMNFKDVPMHEVLESIAEVLGGHWAVKGSTLRFLRGHAFGLAYAAPALAEVPAFPPMPITPEEQKEVERAMQDSARALAEARVELGKIDQTEMRKAMELSRKALEDSKLRVEKLKAPCDVDGPRSALESTRKFMKFAASLTPAQRELHKKQGFLKVSDLTSTQRDLLDLKSFKGEFKLEYKSAGERITIKTGS